MEFSADRRRVLGLMATAGAVAAASTVLPGTAWAKARPVGLEECLALAPRDMAERSAPVGRAWKYLRATAATIKNPGLRAKVMAVLDDPAPTLLARLDSQARSEVFQELTAKGWLKDREDGPDTFLPPARDARRAPQPFLSAPGSGYQSHHSYPGGLVTHTAANVRISLSILEAYAEVSGFAPDRDTVLAAQLLHDLHKPWVFQWDASGESRAEKTLAGTGEHHVLGVAESIARGLPAEVVVAQACAHTHPGAEKDEAQVVGWLSAAAVLAGTDPARAGLLAPDGRTLPLPRRVEGFVVHLGDHDFVFSVPAAKWTIATLREVAEKQYGLGGADLAGAKFNALRNYAFSQLTAEALYREYSLAGAEGLARAVARAVRPA